MISTLILIFAGYFSGSVLYSRLIAAHFLNTDITTVGDGNPGTTNVAKIGGSKWAVIAFSLDLLKAAIPVGIAYYALQITGWHIIPIAIAPAMGHAYPVFFQFRGGKGIAAIAGAWVGIATWEIITLGGFVLLFWFFIFKESAWVTIAMTLSVGGYIVLTGKPASWQGFIVASLIFFVCTHRAGLKNPPGMSQQLQNITAKLW